MGDEVNHLRFASSEESLLQVLEAEEPSELFGLYNQPLRRGILILSEGDP